MADDGREFDSPLMMAKLKSEVGQQDPSSGTDRSLLRRFQSGDSDAATALYVRYANRLMALARSKTGADLATRFDPEDVVQSVFRTFFRRASEGFYAVPPGDELWQLLLVLALNKIRGLAIHHRAQKRDVGKTQDGETLEFESVAGKPDGDVAFHALRMVVDELIHDLSPIQQQVIRDRIEGYEVAEIARRSRRSKRTVERTLQQFRKRLNSLIDDES